MMSQTILHVTCMLPRDPLPVSNIQNYMQKTTANAELQIIDNSTDQFQYLFSSVWPL